MSASLIYQNRQFTPDDFVKLDLQGTDFTGLPAGQQFIHSWQNNKQFFDQKTSGSTGKATIHQFSRKMMEASVNRTVKALNIEHGAKALVCINMDYIGGKMMLARGLMNHWQLHLTAPDSDLTELLIRERFNFSAMVPLQVKKLLDMPEGDDLLNQIDSLIIGGAAVDQSLIEQLQPLKCKVYATYGMTETISHIALQPLNGPNRAEYFSLLPGISHQTDDRDCLMIKADVTDHEWITTNDLVEFIDGQQFKVLGRADNVINTGGVKVQIEELENLILQTGLLGKVNFAISALPDPGLGSKVMLIVDAVVQNPEALLEQLKSVMPAYHAPKGIIRIISLPRTASDKLDRVALREWLTQNS